MREHLQSHERLLEHCSEQILLCENGCMETQFHLKCAFYVDVTGVWKMLEKM